MPLPNLESDNIEHLREQFEAWMFGARSRIRGKYLYDCPYKSRTRKADAWENGWEVIDLEIKDNT